MLEYIRLSMSELVIHGVICSNFPNQLRLKSKTAMKRITKKAIIDLLSEGCDERVHVDPESGRNKYNLKPMAFQTLLQRGSCTANVLTPRSYALSKAFLSKYDELNYESLLEKQAARLTDLVQNDNHAPFDVFFGPSGSDLVYYPLMFQKMLNPGKRIVNIVSCPEELGSGSKYASETRFYANYNQFGDDIEKGAFVDPSNVSEVHYLDARDSEGKILDRSKAIQKIIAENKGASIVGSLVYGSKSGIKDDLNVIDPNDGTMWVVDLCQFRVDKNLIHDLLEKGVMIMITGSKFFQAPPFCAALLVPRKWSMQLREVADASIIAPYGKLFSAYDVPWFMENMRSHLPKLENKALRLRMEIALDEMEAYQYWSQHQTDEMILEWANACGKKLRESDFFELMPDQGKTNDSIISFQVKIGGKALDNAQLKELFKTVCTREYDQLKGGYKQVFFGQPVQYGDKSFIRLAIGAYSVRRLLEKGELDLHNDYTLIDIIEATAKELFA